MLDKIEQVAELAMLHGIPSVGIRCKNTRIHRLQRKMAKHIEAHYYSEVTRLPPKDFNLTVSKLNQWMEATKWGKNPKKLSTIISFIGLMMDTSKHKYSFEEYDTLMDIVDHLIEGNKFYNSSISAAEIAKEKWDKLFKEI